MVRTANQLTIFVVALIIIYSRMLLEMLIFVTLFCLAAYIDLQVLSLELLDDSGSEVNALSIGVTDQRFELSVRVKSQSGTGVQDFISGPDNNYEYRLYLSRTPDQAEYPIGMCLDCTSGSSF